MEKERRICRSGRVPVQPMMHAPPGSISRSLKQTRVRDFPIHPSEIPEQTSQVMFRRSILLVRSCPRLWMIDHCTRPG